MATPKEKTKLANSSNDSARKAFAKQCGITIRTFGADEPKPSYRPIPCGIAEIDEASGIGGLPGGSVVEFFGFSQSGKSYAACQCAAAAQKTGGRSFYIDLEGLDFGRAQDIGVDLESGRFHYASEFDDGESVLDTAQYALSLKEDPDDPDSKPYYDYVVIDSVPMVVPKAEQEQDTSKAVIAIKARLWSRKLPMLLQEARKNNNILILINQIRMKPGVTYGDPETTPGGEAIKFLSHIRIRFEQMLGADWKISRVSSDPELDDEVIGGHSKFKFVKTRVGRPNISGYFPIFFLSNEDLDLFEIMFAKACNAKILRKGWGKFLYPYATGPKQAQFATDDFEEYKDYIIKEGLLPDILEKLGESDPEGKSQVLIENIYTIRERRAAEGGSGGMDMGVTKKLEAARAKRAVEDEDEDDNEPKVSPIAAIRSQLNDV